ncbi:MAG: hypothetical protein ACRD1B_02065 [Thermoanaerobaculia bacterium]
MNLDSLRQEIETFHREVEEEEYQRQGLAPAPERPAIQLGLGPLQIDPLIPSVARHLN